ncbi:MULTISPECIES: N-acetylglucosamine kinase [unclassified Pseudoclavibacter]|uniref:N-acetylglucosamine kinase n=1 Tax=unclassified Pseudoclavibacter TaxID=2615177 RepID=UPI000CE7A8E1|nr:MULTISPECIES: hypothetical protein [unclassified Pseudoclavibacter]PPG00758.1 hypothetical protein C5C19_00940 [Pseudoclavibacter sp. RFBH5]PPG18866.1 hypothetical protein C5E13_17745 [Pseudoclavibacter sp. RFBI4]
MTAPTLRSVGLDVGGTKTHVAFEDTSGLRGEVVVPSTEWRKGSLFSDTGNLARLAGIVHEHGSVDAGTSVAAGLNGVDIPEQARRAECELSSALGTALITVSNDAELLGHALGPEPSLQLIVGTGTVLVGRDQSGAPLRAMGYGWRFNDFGSAPALVREALRELHRLADHTTTAPDPLAELLQAAYGATNLTDLTLAISDRASLTEWGGHAPLIFQAADLGSPSAIRVIADAADYIAAAVHALRQRGAVGEHIVAAGGVITNQPRLQSAIRAALAATGNPLQLLVLDRPPVTGALALASLRHRELRRAPDVPVPCAPLP